ncbi:MAG: integrase [Thermoleophilia bacterium]|nr:integrase [Thermoleophilia bacterium]
MSTRSGWAEPLGSGVRRDHRVACVSSNDRRSGRRCECPYSCWVPDPSKTSGRRRAQIDGSLSPTAARAEKQRLVVAAREAISTGRTVVHAVTGSTPELREWARRCLTKTWDDLSPRTIDTRERSYRLHIDPHLGHRQIGDISPFDIDEWQNTLKAEAGEITRTIEKAVEALRAMLNLAVKLELIDRNPIKGVPRAPKNSNRRRGQRVMSRDEVQQLLDACEETANRAVVLVALECGLRRGEIVALRWRDIDFKARRINVAHAIVQTKTKGRVEKIRKGGFTARPAISPALCDLLSGYRAEAAVDPGSGPNDPVWPGRGRREGKRDASSTMCPEAMGTRISRLITLAGLLDERGKPRFSLHDLRRTGASFAEENNVAESIIGAQLGHAPGSRMTRQHYIRRTEESVQDRYVAGFDWS